MENKAIEFVAEYKLNKTDYDHLHDDLKAGLILTAYAITETNMLMRMYLNSLHPKTGDDLLDSASWTQRHFIIRTLSTKVFEYYEMTTDKHSKNGDASWRNEAKLISESIDATDRTIGYSIAKFMRHEAVNHYSLDAARKNLKFTSNKANFSLYVHDKHGNGYYPVGEEVMFVGRLLRYLNKSSKISFEEAFDAWMQWMREVLFMMSEHYVRMITIHIINKKPDKYAHRRMHYVPFSMVQKPNRPTSPLFMRNEDQ